MYVNNNSSNVYRTDSEVKFVVFCTMLRLDETTVFDELWTVYTSVRVQCVKNVIWKAFSCLQPTTTNINKQVKLCNILYLCYVHNIFNFQRCSYFQFQIVEFYCIRPRRQSLRPGYMANKFF